MYIEELRTTVEQLSTQGKGILAADESTGTITKRFQALGIESTDESRRQYRELLLTAPTVQQYIAGVILYEETLNQVSSDGAPFAELLKRQGILPGIKVDKGLVLLPNTQEENVTQGLDGLPERLAEYKAKGAKFAKWRAVYNISAHTPSQLLIDTNAEVLARYAAICQSQGIVPIVEPEVLIDGNHTLETCERVTESVLSAVFHALAKHKVILELIVLKPNMVINGKTSSQKATPQEVAEATMRVLKRTVPAAVPTINFLSGGQTAQQATIHLHLMNQVNQLPWNVSFSYARALQEDAMRIWKGDAKNMVAAQNAFIKRAKLNSLASVGRYAENMEKEEVSLAKVV